MKYCCSSEDMKNVIKEWASLSIGDKINLKYSKATQSRRKKGKFANPHHYVI